MEVWLHSEKKKSKGSLARGGPPLDKLSKQEKVHGTEIPTKTVKWNSLTLKSNLDWKSIQHKGYKKSETLVMK